MRVAPAILRQIDLPHPPEVVARRMRPLRGFVWLDTAGHAPNGGGVSMLTAEPREVFCGNLSADGDVARLRAALASCAVGVSADCGLPLGGLFGSVEFDGRFCFGVYDEVMFFDHASERWFEVGALSSRLGPEPSAADVPGISFQPQVARDEFLEAVRRALDYIAAGDIYQVNLSHPFVSEWPDRADAFPFYERLRHFSPAPQAAFLDLDGRQILSASPESFLRLSGRTIRTRPIKGTRPRRRDAQEDECSAYDLITSAKEIAELVMITDLERSDLGQVCEYGSVIVTELLKLERFEQVFHLVSTIEGTLRPEVDHLAALMECFPGGSITGAPKKRALEIIRELERFPRGLYTGAIGCLGANGESHFSIAIRTAVAEGSRLHFHAGAGIVADSVPAHEYAETLDKAGSLLGAAAWPHGDQEKPAVAGAAAGG